MNKNFLTVTRTHSWYTSQIDVKNAYLNIEASSGAEKIATTREQSYHDHEVYNCLNHQQPKEPLTIKRQDVHKNKT